MRIIRLLYHNYKRNVKICKYPIRFISKRILMRVIKNMGQIRPRIGSKIRFGS